MKVPFALLAPPLPRLITDNNFSFQCFLPMCLKFTLTFLHKWDHTVHFLSIFCLFIHLHFLYFSESSGHVTLQYIFFSSPSISLLPICGLWTQGPIKLSTGYFIGMRSFIHTYFTNFRCHVKYDFLRNPVILSIIILLLRFRLR